MNKNKELVEMVLLSTEFSINGESPLTKPRPLLHPKKGEKAVGSVMPWNEAPSKLQCFENRIYEQTVVIRDTPVSDWPRSRSLSEGISQNFWCQSDD